MDSSSDGSFAWTDASDDSTDNEAMTTKRTMSNTQSGEESESGRSYKKKLQQQLFSICDDVNGTSNIDDQYVKETKLTQQQSQTENIESPKKKKIKIEQESDVDQNMKKHRFSDTNINDSYDESYLEMKVMSEQHLAVPVPAKTKKSKSMNVSESNSSKINGDQCDTYNLMTSIESKNKSYSSTEAKFKNDSNPLGKESNHMESINDLHETKKKRKKSKNKANDSNLSDSFSEEKIVVEEHIASVCAEGSPVQCIDNANSTLINTKIKKKSRNKTDSISEVEQILNGHITEEIIPLTKIANNTKRKSKISERLRFEDEDDSIIQTKSPKTKSKKSHNRTSKLNNFVECNVNCRPVTSKLASDSVLTGEDDVWVIRCPKDVKVDAFQDKKWIIDNRCKIKLDGYTYEGCIEEQKGNITVLSSDSNDKFVLKNVTINGSVRLHRRIPKAHIQNENVMACNRDNFIPLPETKCRHPLFGLHYKKSIKVPHSVAERLRCCTPHNPNSCREKKTKKRDKKILEKIEDLPVKMEPLAETLVTHVRTSSKKKKKKRKHSEGTDETNGPQPKRSKHDPESAEAWASEKAIEQNLFNF